MKISSEILPILSSLDVDGCRVRIAEQLDRATYAKVNKVLEAIGGKWSRKDKAHMFPTGAQHRLDIVMVTGEVEINRDVGHFPTPVKLAAELVAMAGVRRDMRCLEPSAGTGRIVDALIAVGAHVTCVERDTERRRKLPRGPSCEVSSHDDFMLYKTPADRFQRVVMNPPFAKVGIGDHLAHVMHAYSMLDRGGILVSVLPSSVSFRRDRRHAEFRAWLEERGEIRQLPEGSFKESGTNVNAIVALMENDGSGNAMS